MGKAKPITINGRYFSKRGDALDHFMNKRPELKQGGDIIEGEFFEELKDLYLRYCDYTNWELDGREIKAFIVDYEPREHSSGYASHSCYKVKFTDDKIEAFSVDKAITAILKNEK